MIHRLSTAGWFLILGVWMAAAASRAGEAASPLETLLAQQEWTVGPGTGSLDPHADIDIPRGYMFTGSAGTQALLDAMGNIVDGSEIGFLAPTNLDWFIVFEFNDTGYIKDDDKDKLDADALLKTIRQGTDYANREREKRGIPPLRIVGWEQRPEYNQETHNLEWAIRAESEGEPVLNYNTRLLGRRGVMSANLVVEPDQLADTLPTYNQLLSGYKYRAGETYAEYRSGDKLAQYGLAALIVGGAAAGAAKLGLFASIAIFFKKIWKILIVGVIAVGAWFKRLIHGGRRPSP
ncbi:MAG TPA: DUF2167 domain-containing protein [Candidatus Paceibacterota bacterium]|nr:DUF2167 domain-containing protein [Verrucomicrobiota bacterium]HRZ44721.1 DUF2167 domain-containing protein [Candidatus Paceibacterota bacterium]